MPIKIPDNLPATDILQGENIFVMSEQRAYHQDIRPLKIAIMNLMPAKIITETQILRLLGNSPLQVDVVFLHPATYKSKNTPAEHFIKFYNVFDDIRDEKFDGLIITGAPVEMMEFEEVAYWDELCMIMDWSRRNVYSTMHICWGAQAGLYHHYGIRKHIMDRKLSGVFPHVVRKQNVKLLRGFDDIFYAPQSRYTEIRKDEIEKVKGLTIVSDSEEAGVYIVKGTHGREIYVTGHPEYDPETLKNEYDRDLKKGINPEIPSNYFPEDDPCREPLVRWRGHANLLYANWLNYYVYQETPFDLGQLQ